MSLVHLAVKATKIIFVTLFEFLLLILDLIAYLISQLFRVISSFVGNRRMQNAQLSLDGGVRVLNGVRRKLRLKMDFMFDTYLNPDSGDFPVCDAPVWIFGRSYSVNYDLDELRRSVSSCMWLTYRKNFPSVGDTSLTSDKGWGCMIRTGQMLLAKTLLLRHLGKKWHWAPDSRDPAYLKIVSLFADTRSAPFSLHQIAQCGESLGKPVGSWLGPNTVTQAVKKLLATDSASVDLEIHIAMDSTLVKSEVKRACLSTPSLYPILTTGSVPTSYAINSPRTDPKWKPLLLVVPLRLGLSDLNEAYIPGIRAVFEIPQNAGIIGGRPNHALYFIGYAENEVLFLDPHTVQQTQSVGSKMMESEKAADETYHSQKPGRMSFTAMDPSIAVCFYCESEKDFDFLCDKLSERFVTTTLPLFEICDRRPHDWSAEPAGSSSRRSYSATTKAGPSKSSDGFSIIGNTSTNHSKTRSSPNASISSTSSGPRNASDVDDEEFEILG